MWRWSFPIIATKLSNKVFSTYVEMILLKNDKATDYSSILHVCGDDPKRQRP